MRRAILLCSALFVLPGPLCWSADEPPKVTLTIVEPQAGATLTGKARIVAEVAPAEIIPVRVYASLGGPPYVALSRVKNTNRWTVVLDTTLSPNGELDLLVIAHTQPVKRVQHSIKVRTANPYRCFFGDIHSHTFYSDGSLIPQEAYTYARKVAKLDFFILSDHLELVDDAEWADIREQAFKANEDGKFVALPGLEWTTAAGHANLLDPPGRIWPREITELYATGEKLTYIGMFNHPGDGTQVWNGMAYSEVGDRVMELMEVRDENEEKAYIRALNAGWRIAPAGTDDTHSPTWGMFRAWTGALAPGLSRVTIWHALKSRHCYSTLDRNCWLYFRLGEAIMGDVIADPVSDSRFGIELNDPDSRDLIAKVELFVDGQVVQSVEPKAAAFQWQTAPITEPGKHWAFVKVTQTDGQKLWSAPIWFAVATN